MGASQSSSPSASPSTPSSSTSPSSTSPSSTSPSSTPSSLLTPTPLVVPRSAQEVIDVSPSNIPNISGHLPAPTAPKSFSDFSLTTSNSSKHQEPKPLASVTNSSSIPTGAEAKTIVQEVFNNLVIRPLEKDEAAFRPSAPPMTEQEKQEYDAITKARSKCLAESHASLEGSKFQIMGMIVGGTFSALAPGNTHTLQQH